MTAPTAAAVLLARLKKLGVDYVFANAGTDFPPLIEALAAAAESGLELPEALVAPHESAAMGMAYGYYCATGRAQAVMAHTNVGLANCAIGTINAATDNVPILLFSGRTPVSEQCRFGARTVPIGWGQEMRDQAALVREATKWDYELRFPEQALELADRMHAIAHSTPKGPVYLSLPREVLCEPCPVADVDARPVMTPALAGPNAAAVEQAADILAGAERPVIFAQRGPGSPAAFAALGELARDWGIPVVQYWAVRLALASDHPMNAGVDPAPWLGEADAVLVIDSLAPWSPDQHRPSADCKIIQLGPDPLYSRFPVRNFATDVAIAGETSDAVLALAAAMRRRAAAHDATAAEAVKRRRDRVAGRCAAIREGLREAAARDGGSPPSKAFVSHCLAAALGGRDATILSELGCPMPPLHLTAPDSWYQEPHSGGLGWSFPAGLGMQLADRGRLVVATMGDGSYIFANPVACHQIAEALALPILVVVLNNAEWGAVRQSVLGLYPDGHAARANRMPLTGLSPSPDFVQVAAASRAWTARVDDGRQLTDVLRAALRHIDEMRSQAFVEVGVAP
jgi:acetolactate synthase-1/2/3 large subunit